MADWVAYRIRPDTIGRSEARRWAADPWLAPDETLEPADYTGAPQALRIDRGHQAPLASFSGTPHAADTNYLSNITPQRSDLNQASWMFLESAERNLAIRSTRAVYVLTGPLFERVMPGLPRADEPHRVPSGYWKVVATEDGRVSAFIFEQETPRAASFCAMRVPLEDVERRARLEIFPRMRPRRHTSLDTELGCT
jgi:endonuclease G